MNHEQLHHEASRVLAQNDKGTYTVPHTGNYPHAWLWDSAYHAIGLRHDNPSRAADELRHIYGGQWHNGMIPNIRFGDVKNGETMLWSMLRHPMRAPGIATSGITQPPVLAEAAWLVGETLPHDERIAFWRESVTALSAFHAWLYRERTHDASGLVSVVHPWETGHDNSPALMEHMKTLEWGTGWRQWLADISQLPQFRRDAKHSNIDERSTREEGKLQALGMLSLAACRFDTARMNMRHPLHLQEVGFNSALLRNQGFLYNMADEVGVAIDDSLIESALRQQSAFHNLLWNEDDELYYSRDAVNGDLVRVETLDSLTPLELADTPKYRGYMLASRLTDQDAYWTDAPLPNVPLDSPLRRANGYWHESWINMNWRMYTALRDRGDIGAAEDLRQRTLGMLASAGMREYFNAIDGRGLGVHDFGWTAALAIDLLAENK